ncbi:hypothetical protein H072_6730 [Dactylellina haptotyla CBS 200.50]|uniref:Uncharacterized protein n=1 Tax=Dactylellina haptotyla (strain CBS 200.50) TaxID=1284197 RepID=S8A9M2_DACHA|nr:hypothetical protein H072_6730 [Dactylellina haptotyla CBS 200.50]
MSVPSVQTGGGFPQIPIQALYNIRPVDPFALPNIAERIFLYVPAIDLKTNCRGVSNHWREMITKSPVLREYCRTGLPDPVVEKEGPRHPLLDLWKPVLTYNEHAFLSLFWQRLVRIYRRKTESLNKPPPRRRLHYAYYGYQKPDFKVWEPDYSYLGEIWDLYISFALPMQEI